MSNSQRIKETRFDIEKAKDYFTEILAFSLGPVELKSLMDENKVKIIDVRRKEDFDIAHIPSAISIPYEELRDNFEKLSKEETSVVYCYNQQCHLGQRACLTLAEYGYPVMHLDGGFRVWSEDFRFATSSSSDM